jgi:hypothetical protein
MVWFWLIYTGQSSNPALTLSSDGRKVSSNVVSNKRMQDLPSRTFCDQASVLSDQG